MFITSSSQASRMSIRSLMAHEETSGVWRMALSISRAFPLMGWKRSTLIAAGLDHYA